MLSFIHGHHISLDIDTAVQLHHVADYYEVLRLRDACCQFLLDVLRPHNCCGLLVRSYAVNCEPLTQRCLDTLTLDFVEVVKADPGFAELDPAVLSSVVARDTLVCAEEGEVFEALLKWHAVRPAEKHAALLEMLPLVRWAFVVEKRRPELLESLRAAVADAAILGGDGSQGLVYRSFGGDEGGEAEVRAHRPVGVDEAEVRAAAELVPSVEQYLAQQPPAAQEGEVILPAECRPRHYTWGTLVGRNPEPPSQPQLTPDMQMWQLKSTQEYLIGRSRKSTIRIGHNAPMPYISSQHFRVYNEILWPDVASSSGGSGGGCRGGGGAASSQGPLQVESQYDTQLKYDTQSMPQGRPDSAPRREAWLEDLSQNGTFVNGRLVGRNEKRKLEDGDRIELVFPQESQPRSPNNVNHFPIFTYQAPSLWDDTSQAGGAQRAKAAPSPDCAASQSSSQG